MIKKVEAIVYFSPTAGRRYFTKKAAIHNEVMAKLRNKYPTINDSECGEFFHCSDLQRFDVIYRRLYNILDKSLRS